MRLVFIFVYEYNIHHNNIIILPIPVYRVERLNSKSIDFNVVKIMFLFAWLVYSTHSVDIMRPKISCSS